MKNSGKPPAANPHKTITSPTNLQKAREIQIIGGLLLTIAFFTPTIIGFWYKPTIALATTRILLSGNFERILHFTLGATFLVAPQLFGFIVAVALLATRQHKRPTNHHASCVTNSGTLLKITNIFLLLVLLRVTIEVVEYLPSLLWRPTMPGDFIAGISLLILTWLAYINSMLNKPASLLCQWIWAMLISAGFDIFFTLKGNAEWGMFVAIAGCLTLAFGATREVKLRSCNSWPGTILAIFFCNPRFPDLIDPDRCTTCGYNITHLTTPRCPECGQPCTIPKETM